MDLIETLLDGIWFIFFQEVVEQSDGGDAVRVFRFQEGKGQNAPGSSKGAVEYVDWSDKAVRHILAVLNQDQTDSHSCS